MAEATAADHGHGHAAGRDGGSQWQRDFVADAAGGVLVGFFAGHVGEVDDDARVEHDAGERDDLVVVHAPEVDGHQKRRQLVVRDAAVQQAVDEEAELGVGDDAAVTLALNDVVGSHAHPVGAHHVAPKGETLSGFADRAYKSKTRGLPSAAADSPAEAGGPGIRFTSSWLRAALSMTGLAT